MFKKVIKAVPVLDLRNYTPKALSKIKSISAVALLMLPENPSEEFMDKFSKIKLNAIASTVNVPSDKTVSTFNGVTIVSGENVPDNSICICNGVTVIHSVDSNKNVEFILNGLVIKQSSASVKYLACNGRTADWDFDGSKVLVFNNTIEIGLHFLNNCEEGTVVVAGNKVTISPEVEEDELVKRNIRFAAGNKIVCGKKVYGYVVNKSVVGNKVEVED